MRTVEAKATVAPMQFPAGTEPGPYEFRFISGSNEFVVQSSVPSCTVTLDAGEWACEARRLSSTGAQLGEVAFTTFAVPGEGDVTIGVVGSVSVTVAESIKTVKGVTVR
jgi:hypothetical protein